jgi:tRNA1(Val) A37 N6-methylase TrmN6
VLASVEMSKRRDKIIMVLGDTDETEDRLHGGRVIVFQPAHGYRAGMDAVMLAAAIGPGGRLLEAGCGAGAALFCVASRQPSAELVGVERDPAMADRARRGVTANSLSARATILEGDVFELGAVLRGFDGVFVNPPFDQLGTAQAPHPDRQDAYLTEKTLDRWIAFLSDRLTGGGVLTLIQRAEKLAEILSALDGRLGSAAVFPLRPKAHAPAKRVLVRAVKGGRAPLALLKGLDLHDDSGARHTIEAEAILSGTAPISWR